MHKYSTVKQHQKTTTITHYKQLYTSRWKI